MVYAAYGLRISTNREIPRLASARTSGASDVHIEFGARPASLDPAASAVTHYRSPYLDNAGNSILTLLEFETGWWHLRYVEGIDFFVSPSGTHVVVSYTAPLTIDDVSS